MILGAPEAAGNLMRLALPVMIEFGVLPRAADTSMALSIVSGRIGDVTEAARYARQAVEIVQRLGDRSRTPIVLDAAFDVAVELGLQSQAVRIAAAAAHLRAKIGRAHV